MSDRPNTENVMPKPRVDYDQIARGYDRRFAVGSHAGTAAALQALVEDLQANRVLEVGCGTGHWLAELASSASELYGLDASAGMLRQARSRPTSAKLVHGYARQLPVQSSSFDLVFCVNALHHFQDPQAFVREASRVLQVGGKLAIVGSNPHGRKDDWYVYDYFEGAWETDLERFPRWDAVTAWLRDEGFHKIESREVERIHDPKYGRQVLNDPFLEKNACSQLALLPHEAYVAGLRKIEAALTEAEVRGETLVFQSDISIRMLTGSKAQ